MTSTSEDGAGEGAGDIGDVDGLEDIGGPQAGVPNLAFNLNFISWRVGGYYYYIFIYMCIFCLFIFVFCFTSYRIEEGLGLLLISFSKLFQIYFILFFEGEFSWQPCVGCERSRRGSTQ